MKYLNEYTNEDLQEELERRGKATAELEKPQQLETFDLTPLMKICSDYIDFVATDYHDDSDWDHYIYETAIEALYGKDVWDWIREQMK